MKFKNMDKGNNQKIKSALTRLAVAFFFAAFIAATVSASEFIEQRRKFRDEIKNKSEKKLDDKGDYLSVIFDKEKGKYDFKVTDADRARLKEYSKSFFGISDEAMLDKMIDEVNQGSYVIYKEYQTDGVQLKVLFLSPQAKYWDWLTDANGIENLFHTYNYSIGLYNEGDEKMYTVLQTEGSFFGITQAVNVPLVFWKDDAKRTFTCRMPTEKEMQDALARLKPVKEGRDKSDEKFIDACRLHPYFQTKDSKGNYEVSDEDILKIYNEVVANMAEECPVKQTDANWNIQEDYPYLVVDYTLKSRVNVAAFIPSSMSFLSGAVEKFAQTVSDEVSVKYLPLSMKNFRDLTQEWTKTGGPDK